MRAGALAEDGVIYPWVQDGGKRRVLRDLAGHDVRAFIGLDETSLRAALDGVESPPAAGAVNLPPLRPGKIVAIGLNYMDHVRETGMDAPASPLVFAKFPSCLAADGQEIVVDGSLTSRVDWEVELAVVIGAGGKDIVAADALEHVFGYTVGNDLSARDLQFGDGQWVRGKSLDGFCPLGPAVVTRDEVPDPQALELRTLVNGQVMQQSTTAEMIFGVAALIEFCSHSFRLDAGDVLLTGTPWGCGEFMEPRVSLRDGDRVEVSVQGLGTLTNTIRVV